MESEKTSPELLEMRHRILNGSPSTVALMRRYGAAASLLLTGRRERDLTAPSPIFQVGFPPDQAEMALIVHAAGRTPRDLLHVSLFPDARGNPAAILAVVYFEGGKAHSHWKAQLVAMPGDRQVALASIRDGDLQRCHFVSGAAGKLIRHIGYPSGDMMAGIDRASGLLKELAGSPEARDCDDVSFAVYQAIQSERAGRVPSPEADSARPPTSAGGSHPRASGADPVKSSPGQAKATRKGAERATPPRQRAGPRSPSPVGRSDAAPCSRDAHGSPETTRKPLPDDLMVTAYNSVEIMVMIRDQMGISLRKLIELKPQPLHDLLHDLIDPALVDTLDHLVVIDDATAAQLKGLIRSTLERLRPDLREMPHNIGMISRSLALKELGDVAPITSSLPELEAALSLRSAKPKIVFEDADFLAHCAAMNRVISRRPHGRSATWD
jgi:hypothetical protein